MILYLSDLTIYLTIKTASHIYKGITEV